MNWLVKWLQSWLWRFVGPFSVYDGEVYEISGELRVKRLGSQVILSLDPVGADKIDVSISVVHHNQIVEVIQNRYLQPIQISTSDMFFDVRYKRIRSNRKILTINVSSGGRRAFVILDVWEMERLLRALKRLSSRSRRRTPPAQSTVVL